MHNISGKGGESRGAADAAKELNEGVHKLYVRNDRPTGNKQNTELQRQDNSRKEQMAFKFCGGNHKRGAVNCMGKTM